MFGQKHKAVIRKLESIECKLDSVGNKIDHLTVSVKNKHEAQMAKINELLKAVSKPKTISLVWVRRVREPIPTEKG